MHTQYFQWCFNVHLPPPLLFPSTPCLGFHIGQPGPGDVMIYSILLKFPASLWIISHCLFTFSTTSATFSALHITQTFLLEIQQQSCSIYFSSVGYQTMISFLFSYFTSLSNFLFFLLSSNISQVTQIGPWLRGSTYLVWLVLTIHRYACRSTWTAIWCGSLITYFQRYLERSWGILAILSTHCKFLLC